MEKTVHSTTDYPENPIPTSNENLPQSTFLCSKCKSTSKNTTKTGFLQIKTKTNVEKFLRGVTEDIE